MLPVWCFGEVLIDFLTIGQQQEASLRLPEYRQYPGGAPANAAVAVAKLGGQAGMIGQVGADQFGQFLRASLAANGVDTSRLLEHPQALTPLAFVLLDASGERSFEFYRRDSADLLFAQQDWQTEWFAQPGMLHLCSNTLTEAGIRAVSMYGVQLAKQAGWLVSVDVNLRANLWPQHQLDIPAILALCAQADVLKVSRDELDALGGEALIATWRQAGARLILVTDGGQPLHYYSQGAQGVLAAPAVKAVDTTAAGDSFSGAVLYGLSRCLPTNPALWQQQAELEALLAFALACGAHTVTRPGAIPALPCFADVSHAWQLA
ncbi:carbohydrate kinase family protein [Balneatrix alpica]|uniref:carbohydrate kinase family protein n=1 Tax=Balneatrix alpica TaxID=75684 RepID=UPI00273957AA|nr:carbohydrate kinase [Balneatrix alpica]